jgi:hypothetical protein
MKIRAQFSDIVLHLDKHLALLVAGFVDHLHFITPRLD